MEALDSFTHAKSDRYEVVDSIESHVYYIAENMREVDRKEIWYSGQSKPIDSLMRGFNSNGLCYTMMVNDKPAIMFGSVCYDLIERKASAWLLSTDGINDVVWNRQDFEMMRGYVQKMAEGYSILENYVHSDNETSIKWLEALGFTVHESAQMGVFNEPFRHFEMRMQ